MGTDAEQQGLLPEHETVFGTPGAGVTTWGLLKKDRAGKFQRCEHPGGDGTYARVWPLVDLTPDIVRERWGAGEYKVAWFIDDPENPDPKRRHLGGGCGRPFRLEEPEPVRIAAPGGVPAATPMPVGFESAMQFMALIDQRAGAQLTSTLQIANAIAGRSGGLDAERLGLMLEKQQTAFTTALQQIASSTEAAIGAVRSEMAALRSELDGDEDEDEEDETAPVAAVAKAAAPLFKPGKPIGDTIKTAILNYAAENPDKIVELLKGVPAVVTALGTVMQQAQQSPPSAPTSPAPARPRAVATVTPLRTEAPPPPGLNQLLAQPPKEQGGAEAPAS